jgi:hypothetical protein
MYGAHDMSQLNKTILTHHNTVANLTLLSYTWSQMSQNYSVLVYERSCSTNHVEFFFPGQSVVLTCSFKFTAFAFSLEKAEKNYAPSNLKMYLVKVMGTSKVI